MTNPQKLSQSLPLDRLYAIHRDLKVYQQKWTESTILDSVFAPGHELTFTTIQYVNRILSPIGPILIATGHSQAGGIVSIIFLYVEFGTTYYKEKVFKTGEKQARWTVLNQNTENLLNSYQELAEILKPIRIDNSLGKIGEVIKILKEKINEFSESDDQNEVNLLSSWVNDRLYPRRVVRWFKNLPKILVMEPLPRVSQKAEAWLNEWRERNAKREEIKFLLEVLQGSISEYRQGVAEEEIKEKINKKLSELRNIEVQVESGEMQEQSETNESTTQLTANVEAASGGLNR